MPDDGALNGADLLARVRRFALERIAPAAEDWSLGASPTSEDFAAAGALGLTRLQVAAADGGLGLPFSAKTRAAEVLATADFGFAMALINTQNAAIKIAERGAETLKARRLPRLLSGEASACTALTEPGAGSDFGSVATQARPEGDGWVLTGEKTWIINARHAETCIVYAQTAALGDRDGVAAFVVDLTAPGVTRTPLDSAFAQTSIGCAALTFEAVRLPADAQLLSPGEAFRAILAEINGARAYVAAMGCGMLEAALEEATAYGASRESFGKPLAAHQAWRLGLAQAGVDLAAARALTAQAVAAVEADEGSEAAQRLCAQAKVFATNACLRRLPELMHAMGAEGLSPRRPFARHLAGAQSATLTDGSTEMLLERLTRLGPGA
ncbi:MAG: acyl-CoA dehydrogenase [Pseudomonadota bacterium]